MNPYPIPERVWSLLSNLRASMQLLLPRSKHVRRQVAAIATLLIGSEAAARVSLMRRLQNSPGNIAATFAPDQTAEMQETAPTETADGNHHRRLSATNPSSAMPSLRDVWPKTSGHGAWTWPYRKRIWRFQPNWIARM